KAFKKQVPEWVEAAVVARARVGLIGTIERRIGAALSVPREFNKDESWTEIRAQLIEATRKAHEARAERSLGEIERELKQNLPAAPGRDDLARALIGMAFGTVTGFDQKTHRKVAMRTQRLNYFFVAADSTSDWTAADLKTDINEHLHGALEALRTVWGEAEHRRLGAAKVAELPPPLRTLLDGDETLAAALPTVATVGELSGPARDAAIEVLGNGTLMQ